MTRFYEPDLSTDLDSPFIRDGANKLVRRSYWLDMDDRTLVMVMVSGIGSHLTNDEKRAHLADLRREHLIDQVCVQEIFRPRSSSARMRGHRKTIWAGDMMTKQRISDLERSHQALEDEIAEAMLSKSIDHLKITDLKRRKLHQKRSNGCVAKSN